MTEMPVRSVPAKVDDPPEPVDAHGEQKLPRGSSPADTLISPRVWKHVAVGVLCLLSWGGVLWLGESADRAATGMESIVGLAAGKLTTFFSTVMLLAAGQLAFISLWYRSRSRKDFNGSYKLWFWTAVSWLTLCAFQATGAHWSVADAALSGRPVAVWNGRLLVWLVPAAIIAVALYRLLRREMRDCRESLWTLRLAALAAAATGVTLLCGQFALTPRGQLVAEASLNTAWHMLLAYSMLLHARHVIHISNEPPRSVTRRLRLPWPRLRLPSLPRRRKAKQPKKPGNSKPVKQQGAKSPAAKPKRRTDKAAPTRPVASAKTKRAETNVDASDDETDGIELVAEPPVRQQPQRSSPPTSRRADPPQRQAARKPHIAASADADDSPELDDDDLRGLSKKERRRLKKLKRQKARAAR